MEVGPFPACQKSKYRICCVVRGCESKTNKILNVVF